MQYAKNIQELESRKWIQRGRLEVLQELNSKSEMTKCCKSEVEPRNVNRKAIVQEAGERN